MRDAWSLWLSNSFQTRLHYKKIYNLEKTIFNRSSLVIGVTPELINDFRNQHPEISPLKFETIFNGYDDFITKNFQILETDKSIFKIGYVGSFYFDPRIEKTKTLKWYKRKGLKKLYYSPRKEEWLYRSPYFFFKSLSKLLTINPELRDKVVFEFVGSTPYWLDNMIKKFSLQKNFINHGFRTKQEVLRIQSSWNAILATSEKINNGEHFCLPSKIFDAVASQKLIFAFLTPGSQYNFLKNYSQVTFFKPHETEFNITKLFKIINGLCDDIKIDKLSVEYQREYQAKKMLNLLLNLKK